MATTFSSLPIVDVSALKSRDFSPEDLQPLSRRLYDVFATTGFAYLVNPPLSFSHADVFRLTASFFALPEEEKMKLAKKSFRKDNGNTYRGYFPTQPDLAADNLKEGFEMGPSHLVNQQTTPETAKINLTEPNVWPDRDVFPHRSELEKLYAELQSLASKLLSLLAMSLGKPSDFFAPYLEDSISTLRLLHYPIVSRPNSEPGLDSEQGIKLSCTPHTDSGILTLLHQDTTGGLEVRNSSGSWVPAPYIPESIVVNIGDLMATVSGGRFVATMHRVQAPEMKPGVGSGSMGRFSVPFFFEPGENCLVRAVDGDQEVVRYGLHVREKMKGFVEFKDV